MDKSPAPKIVRSIRPEKARPSAWTKNGVLARVQNREFKPLAQSQHKGTEIMDGELQIDETAAFQMPQEIDEIVASLLDREPNEIEDVKLHQLGEKSLVIVTVNAPIPTELNGKSVITRYQIIDVATPINPKNIGKTVMAITH